MEWDVPGCTAEESEALGGPQLTTSGVAGPSLSSKPILTSIAHAGAHPSRIGPVEVCSEAQMVLGVPKSWSVFLGDMFEKPNFPMQCFCP